MSGTPSEPGRAASEHWAGVTTIYCDRCDHTIYYSATGNDELIEAAELGDQQAAAHLAQARADLLTTHQMGCAG